MSARPVSLFFLSSVVFLINYFWQSIFGNLSLIYLGWTKFSHGPLAMIFWTSCYDQRAALQKCTEVPRGAVVHECTSFSPGNNLVGPIIANFSFAECFAVGALAKPNIALSERGLLRLPDLELPQRVLQSWSGIEYFNQGTETGLAIEDPRKFSFTANIIQEDGTDINITATAHDFHCMSHLLDCFNPDIGSGLKPITKPIVFCPNNKVARRCKAVFRALASQRVRAAQQLKDTATAALYKSIISEHVFQSDCSAPNQGQSYEERQRSIWRFRGAAQGGALQRWSFVNWSRSAILWLCLPS